MISGIDAFNKKYHPCQECGGVKGHEEHCGFPKQTAKVAVPDFSGIIWTSKNGNKTPIDSMEHTHVFHALNEVVKGAASCPWYLNKWVLDSNVTRALVARLNELEGKELVDLESIIAFLNSKSDDIRNPSTEG